MSEPKRKRPVFWRPKRKPESTSPHVDTGLFHRWADVEGNSINQPTKTVALIEDNYGEIHQVDPEDIKFRDRQ